MESELSAILSSKCRAITNDAPLCARTHKKCCPVKKCSPKFHRDAISVVSLNPRFSDSVRWEKILSPFPQTSSVSVFNLRRTNLIKLAYSKYHHGGCPVMNEGLDGDECFPKSSTFFSFDCLLQCVQHYGEYKLLVVNHCVIYYRSVRQLGLWVCFVELCSQQTHNPSRNGLLVIGREI